MNEKLQFSWGHIFAFLAMIMISYLTYTGAAYLYDTNLTVSALWAIGTFFVLFVVFVGTQQLKATEQNFSRNILLERIGVVLSVVVFLLMISISPFKHFWTVYGNRSEITSEFAFAIDSSKSIFENYDAYVDARVNQVLASKNEDKETMAELLKMQLRPTVIEENGTFDYETKEQEILAWIDAAKESSVWNVFMLGNLTEIQEGVESWKTTLESWTEKSFYDGDMAPYHSEFDIVTSFNTLKQKYTETKIFQWRAVLWALVGYFFLALPWLLQRRPVKNPYGLLGKKEWTEEYEEENEDSSETEIEQTIVEVDDDDRFEI